MLPFKLVSKMLVSLTVYGYVDIHVRRLKYMVYVCFLSEYNIIRTRHCVRKSFSRV